MAERRNRRGQRWLRRGLWALAGLAGAFLVVFALVIGPWWLTQHPHRGLTAEQELKAKNDVRTTLVQALGGLALAGGLIVTYRTFRHNRIEQDRSYALRHSEQVNEFYTKAVEQLGHEQAPVRLGALYSLVHLAQANPQQRQTVVDVLCAYLRMPYTPPARPAAAAGQMTTPAAEPNPTTPAQGRDPDQELQVRQTAQRLLADHLRRRRGIRAEGARDIEASPDQPFWPGIRLDLAGATLLDLELSGTSVVTASFARATFDGDASFRGATFTEGAWFNGATFTGEAQFGGASFIGTALFAHATFTSEASFHGADFTDVYFDHATFTDVHFDDATFDGDISLGANFTRRAWFYRATFDGDISFGGAYFTRDPVFEDAHVLHIGDEDDYVRVWPSGWTVRPDPIDPTRGTLVREEQVEAGGPGRSSADADGPMTPPDPARNETGTVL